VESVIDPEFLIRAYSAGVFPMAVEDGEIAWFSPDPRGVMPLDTFHVPHGLRRALKKTRFELRINSAFEDVISGCANREETWIDEKVHASFCELHRQGHAHSVETWSDGALVGGLYGVSIGSAFFGESMFSRESNASQAALVALVERLKGRGFLLLDTQWTTPHLKRFGAVDIPKKVYLQKLVEAVRSPNCFV